MEKKRSVGVTVIAIISVVYPIIHTIGLFWLFSPFKSILLRVWLVFLVCCLLSILSLVAGVGMLILKNWARVLFIRLVIARLFFGILAEIYMRRSISPYPPKPINWLSLFFCYIFPSVIFILYLTRPKVKALFSPEREEMMEKKRSAGINIFLILLIIIATILFIQHCGRPRLLSGIRPAADKVGVLWTQENFITIEVKDIDIAINHFKELDTLKDIRVNFGRNAIANNVELFGENKKELSDFLLKECEKIGKVLRYSLKQGLNTPKQTGITIRIDFVTNKKK